MEAPSHPIPDSLCIAGKVGDTYIQIPFPSEQTAASLLFSMGQGFPLGFPGEPSTQLSD